MKSLITLSFLLAIPNTWAINCQSQALAYATPIAKTMIKELELDTGETMIGFEAKFHEEASFVEIKNGWRYYHVVYKFKPKIGRDESFWLESVMDKNCAFEKIIIAKY